LLHIPMQRTDRYLWTLPMFHANGWTFVWSVSAVGAAHICLRKVEPARVFELIRTERASIFCAAPTVLIGVAGASADVRAGAPKGLRVVTAGAPPAAATIERVEGELGWTITHVYGLTETAPFITVCEPRPEHDALNASERAVIKARQGVELITSGELRVVDDEMRDVPRDGQTVGEIVVRGNVVMKGYYNDPEATAQALRGGYFHSGDAAVVHADGYVDIRDRLKDVIISGGENISSVEVEGVLLRHPAVQEAAVVGLPDARWGEAPHAFVVLKAGANCSPEDLRAHTRERLAHSSARTALRLSANCRRRQPGRFRSSCCAASVPPSRRSDASTLKRVNLHVCVVGAPFQGARRSDRLGRLNQRKNAITRTAGMSGPHHASRPIAISVREPSFTNSMMAPAQPKALTRFSRLNLSGGVLAYAQATGIAVRSPGRNRPARTIAVSLRWTRSLTASR